MTAPARRFSADAAGATLAILAVLAAVVLALDGVDHARWIAERGAWTWLARVTAALPSHLAAALPVAAALAAALVAARWARDGRLAALEACGWSPRRLALAAALGVGLAAIAVAAARGVAAPVAERVREVEGTWAFVAAPVPGGDVGHALIGARTLDDAVATGVTAAWVRDGRAVGRFTAPELRWDGHAWRAPRGEPVVGLPEPIAWRRAATGADLHTPLVALWGAESSPARDAWLVERLATPLGAVLLAVIAAVAGRLRPRRAAAGMLAVSVLWRLVQAGLVAVAARGWIPVGLAVGLPVLLLLAAALAALAAGERHSAYSTTTQ